MNVTEFKNARFGFASAEKESAEDPTLLSRGFLNHLNMIDDLRDGSKFLVLGDKGSGKTSIATHFHLLAEDDPKLFVKRLSLADLPFTSFSNIVKGKEEPEAKYPTAWMWIFLVLLVDSLSEDMGVPTDAQAKLHSFHRLLQAEGLAPSDDLPAIIRKSSKKSFSINLMEFVKLDVGASERPNIAQVPELVDSMKRLVSGCKTDSKHLIILDGLDDILTKREKQFDVLGALIFEASRLNNWLISAGINAKIVVLSRQDIFVRISGANKNKIRQNYAVELNWYQHPSDPGKPALFQLVDHRAAQTIASHPNVFNFLNQQPKVGPQMVQHYLMEYTRHRPRDLIVLLSTLQGKVDKIPINPQNFHSAARVYAQNYFVGEIADELYGFADQEIVSEVFKILGSLKEKEFSFLKAQSAISQRFGKNMDSYELFNRLYECGAIGQKNINRFNRDRYSYQYSHPQTSFSPDQVIRVHRALASALNLD